MQGGNFEKQLNKYAQLIVNVGLNLQVGQRLNIFAMPLETVPLLRLVTEAAYKAGSPLVNVFLSDAQLQIIRYQHAPNDSFEEIASWQTEGLLKSVRQGDAYLQISGVDPNMFKDVDSQKLATVGRTRSKHFKEIADRLSKNEVQWCTVSSASPAWAKLVFPDVAPKAAEKKLWEAVFEACRITEEDPIAFWWQQEVELSKRKMALTSKQFKALHFKAPGTDLKVGLADGHSWEGGSDISPKGIKFMANLPTEEVYTMPHKDRVEGTVRATKPLSHHGNLIENFSLAFEQGKVVEFSAEKGEDILRNILESDEAAKSLGEVALIPHQTPISQMGLLFYNTLYDENTTNHMALGNAYPTTLKGGMDMSKKDIAAAGGNNSLVHVDFMFGSEEMDVDGEKADGSREPVMRGGEWAFDA